MDGAANKVERVVFQFFPRWSRAEGMMGLDGAASKVDHVVGRLLSICLFFAISKPYQFAIFCLETCVGDGGNAAIGNRWVGLLATLAD